MRQLILRTKKPSIASSLVKEAIENELKLIKNSIAQLESTLKKFEGKYKLTSKRFYANYQKGKTSDDLDFIDWAGRYQLFLDLKEQYYHLKELEICQ
ncbi:MAG: hypothetical protein A2149_04860 [Candidatus Schekmanbacteria bacterium RBG_16_38_11]|uniref:Uncharacterized protein n=1 Tax=Candidatus Schekmanbacteria bacterium RBG_16_38_11 TaxID=1817880 RepID=A0A1F7RRD7_9BACT|nr:MAG: hypothetical protein A2149_04860 [Candidatus Schekmanbacteria bacterium RBG_16_38_11]